MLPVLSHIWSVANSLHHNLKRKAAYVWQFPLLLPLKELQLWK